MVRSLLFLLLPSFLFSQDYCGGEHFYDSGGAGGSYQNNENVTTTIYPQDIGYRVRVVFNSFELSEYGDFFAIYNGPDFNGELLYYGSADSTPVYAASTHPTGALTFIFWTNASGVADGWDATVICEPVPACDYPPAQFTASNITKTTATLSWTDGNPGVNTWEYRLYPHGSPPAEGNGITLNSNPFVATDLEPGACYDFYLRTDCFEGFTTWAGPFYFCTQPDYCAGDHFYDSGGAEEDYSNNDNYVTTIYPETPGDRIRAEFDYFLTDGCCDFMSVFNGPDDTYPLLFSGYESPGSVASTHDSGALTFRFYANGTQHAAGWDAQIICEPMPACANPPTYLSSIPGAESATLMWLDNADAEVWEVEVLPNFAPPTGNPTHVAYEMPFVADGLTEDVHYDFYVRSVCGSTPSPWSEPSNFTTGMKVCNEMWYDPGGPDAYYGTDQDELYLFYPQQEGQAIEVDFSMFDLDLGDGMYIFNGPTTNDPLLYNGNFFSPGTVTSTHETGALTFYFYSDGEYEGPGWAADISCTELSTPDQALSSLRCYPNPVADVLQFESKAVIDAIDIHSYDGRLVHRMQGPDEKKLDLGHFETGVYFATFRSGASSKTVKIIKQ